MEPRDPNRGTGRTYRQLQACAAEAKAGKHVVFVAPSRPALDIAMRELASIAGADARPLNSQQVVIIGPKGAVYFAAAPYDPEKYRGLRARVEFDHAVS